MIYMDHSQLAGKTEPERPPTSTHHRLELSKHCLQISTNMDVLNESYQKGLVVGLRDVAGVVPRLDIDELLLKHPETFNLLIIALKELKGEDVPWQVPSDFKVAKGDKLSFFQIAGTVSLCAALFHLLSLLTGHVNVGIHGLPLTEWDNEHAPGKTPNGGNPGYCAHGTPTFGPWHRPYLAMLEAIIPFLSILPFGD